MRVVEIHVGALGLIRSVVLVFFPLKLYVVLQAGRKALVAVVIGLRFVAGGPTPERPASPRRRRKGAWRRKGAPQRPPLVLVQSSDGRRGPNPDVRTTCCGCQAQARSADRREAASAGRTTAGEPVLRMPLLVERMAVGVPRGCARRRNRGAMGTLRAAGEVHGMPAGLHRVPAGDLSAAAVSARRGSRRRRRGGARRSAA